jgi:arylsulfatase A
MALVHSPFVPTPNSKTWEFGDRYNNDTKYFADMVNYMDKVVGEILDKLQELDLLNDTIVLFTGDNGTHTKITSQWKNREYPGGKGNMWEPGTHVPLIVKWNDNIKPNSVCKDLIDFSDFLPSFVEAAQVKLPQNIEYDGRSFVPQLRGEKGDPRNWVYCHYDQGKNGPTGRRHGRFAREKRYKLYMNGNLYDVPADLLEEHPLEGNSPEAKAARARLQEVLDSMPPWKEITKLKES